MPKRSPRILVVDDEPGIITAYKSIFSDREETTPSNTRLSELTEKLFSAHPSSPLNSQKFEIHYCNQGTAAVQATQDAIQNGNPFCTAFIDIRMPPGPDGVWTASKIRELDPLVNIVIVTAYSDISPRDIGILVQPPERLLYVQKPFHSHEIWQFAVALSAKWRTEKELMANNERLDQLVQDKTSDLSMTIESLEKSNNKYSKMAQDLIKTERELTVKADDLSGTNLALQHMMQKNKEDRHMIGQKVLFSIHEMVEPYLQQLQKTKLNDTQQTFLKLIHNNLLEITAPFMKGLSHKYFRLNPTEIQVANLIRQGKTTIKIAEELNTTKRNIDFYRDQIRDKIGIKNTKANLRAVLQDLESELIKRQ